MNIREVTLLGREDIYSSKKIDTIYRENGKCTVSDYAIVRGCYAHEEENSNCGNWLLRSNDFNGKASYIDSHGNITWMSPNKKIGGIRPVLKGDFSFSEDQIEYGEYPQKAVDNQTAQMLFKRISHLKETGKEYVVDYVYDSTTNSYTEKTAKEYSFYGKKYVYVPYKNDYRIRLTNDNHYQKDIMLWIEVCPISWIVDKQNKQLISKSIISSGIPFTFDNHYDDHFDHSFLYWYLNHYFIKEIIPSNEVDISKEEEREYKEMEKGMEKKRNRYQFSFQSVSEEDILRGAIESDIPVFLHGASAEGKSSRVKQIDPNCLIIHMENATLDSFVGKSVYSEKTGRMMNLPPAWYDELVSLCEKEPNQNHILFFEEFTNATPSVQGKVNNVILDRIVDGKWKLPENVRIVGAGNEVEDSLAANPMTETVFSRFAHIYIKTSTKDWLKWARENHIHPMICSYVAYRRGEVLRSDYDGINPNADPRKWEMASKMLYKTNNPLMLRSLVGEEITSDFISFCNSRVITLEDVLQGNYTEEDIASLNVSERYATTMALLDAEFGDFEIVSAFVKKMGTEFNTLFTSLWVDKMEDDVKQIENSFNSMEKRLVKKI